MKLRHLALAIGLVVPGVAWSAECDLDLAKVDAAIQAGPQADVTAEQFEQARQLRTKAADMLKAGDDAGCMAAIDEALELLGAED